MRILIIKLSSLGDVFHALPTVHMLRTAYPEATIDWVAHTAYQPLISCFLDVDNSIAFPRNSYVRDARTFLQTLRQQKYDLILDLQGLLKSSLVARLAKGKRKIGPSFCREGSRFLYHATAGRPNFERHAVEQILDVVDYLEIPRSAPVFPISFPQYQPPGSPHVVIAPASRWPSKNWPPERFAAVAQQLQQEYHAHIAVIGAPGEEDICQSAYQQLSSNSQNHAGQTSLVEMGSIIASADLLIANDSGPVHMAAAVGTPSVVLFGPTDPVRIGPYGTGHQILTPAIPCDCPRQRVCQHPETACIKTITVDQAYQAAISILS